MSMHLLSISDYFFGVGGRSWVKRTYFWALLPANCNIQADRQHCKFRFVLHKLPPRFFWNRRFKNMNVPGTAQVDLNTAEEIVDYAFKNRNLLSEALHSPIRDRDETSGEVLTHDGNRRLANLGRHVLQTILCDDWYGQPSLHHGAVTLCPCCHSV